MGDIANLYGGQAFDTSSVPPATGFDPIPAGWYPVLVESAIVSPTNDGQGTKLSLELQVIGGQYTGRKLFANINLVNASEKAVEIGARELAGLGLACGLRVVTDTSELLQKQVEARVKMKPAKDGYEAGNAVSAYRPLPQQGAPQQAAPQAAAPAPTPQAAAPPQAAPQTTTAAKMPWEAQS